MSKNHDVRIVDTGSIVQFFLLTPEAREWVTEHVRAEGWQFLGNSLCVEARYVEDLVAGMEEAGLVLV